MLSGIAGISSPGQFALGAIGYATAGSLLLPAPFDRTFFVPQNGLPWEGSKTPGEEKSFSFDWTGELNGDLIISSAWTFGSSDVSAPLNAVDDTKAITTALIFGGISANIYDATNDIITLSGLELSATFRLFINSYNR